MPLWELFIWVALAGAVVLMLDARLRPYAIVALVAAGFEALMAADLVTLDISGTSLPLILGGGLVASGALSLWRAFLKRSVIAATLVTAVGALQLARALELLG